jgi:hypothetical protein
MKANDSHQENVSIQSASLNGALAVCRQAAALIENAKASILSEFQDSLREYQQLLRLALNEAESIAWQTGYPHLLFPALAREKAQTLAGWQARQRLLKQSLADLALAA